jgi:hypothetical protein
MGYKMSQEERKEKKSTLLPRNSPVKSPKEKEEILRLDFTIGSIKHIAKSSWIEFRGME